MIERVPPYSEEAERASLGALLVDSLRLMPIVRRMGLTGEAWYTPALRIVAEAALAIDEKQRMVDVVTVQEWLRTKGNLDQAGGPLFVSGLIDACPTAAHGEYYLDIVGEKWLLRKQIQACRLHEQSCHEGTENAQALVARGQAAFAELIGRDPREKSNREIMDESLQLWRDLKAGKQEAAGLPTPWPKLTKLSCGLEPGLTVVAGRPGAGKSTLEGLLCDYLSIRGMHTARVTLDMTRQDLLDRLVAKHAGVSLKKLKAGFAREDQLAQAAAAIERLDDSEFPMHINDRDRELKRICAWARMMKQRYDIAILTVDFIQKVEVAGMRDAYDQTRKTTVVTDRLKALSFELGIPVIGLSQLSREGEKAQRDPRLTDLRDSGSIEQDASKVWMLYPDQLRVKEMEELEAGSSDRNRPICLEQQKAQNAGHGTLYFWFRCSYFRLDSTDSDFREIQETKDENLPDWVLDQDRAEFAAEDE